MENQQVMWWQDAFVYQIYPLSFQDSNGDGIGDIPGIMSRLDHIKELGIDVIWLSPVFMSPMKDNGYDVSDYRAVNPMFGTLDDLKKLVDAVHARGMKIISDIVLNHTSDQHPWFIDAINHPRSPYRDYFIFRQQKNEISSVFSGPAWTKVPGQENYYFHLFAKEQPDLNWQHQPVRETLYTILNYWLQFGFDGYRLDVIDLIGKDVDTKQISNGPYFSSYMEELKQYVFKDRSVLTVGELSGSSIEQASLTTDAKQGYLSMAFQFSHLWLDEQPHRGKWALKPLVISDLKATFTTIDRVYQKHGWNALFMTNHDQPRAVSRYGDDNQYRYQSQTMLFLAFLNQRGTPFIYQGEEIGMINYPFETIVDCQDIESLRYYQEAIQSQSHDSVMQSIRAKGRDNARTPMQWDDSLHAGFSTHTPWLKVHPLYPIINVKRDKSSQQSIFQFLQTYIRIRKSLPVIRDGRMEFIDLGHDQIYAYRRFNDQEEVLTIASFSNQPLRITLPNHQRYSSLIQNEKGVKLEESMLLPPYFGGMFIHRYANH